MSLDTKKVGDKGEQIASEYLEKHGFEIIERNIRFGRMGEIDLIAKDGGVTVFVEVKTRKNLNYGEPEYAITKSKMNQIKKLANAYLYEKKISEIDCRFDVVTILYDENGKKKLNHIANAF
jgi:putative endonuclease